MRINGKKVVAVKRNGREFIRVARGGVDLWTNNALPSGFTALEYVQSSGSQYVDTGIIGKSGLEVSLKFSFKDVSSVHNVFGVLEGTNRIFLQYDNTEGLLYAHGSWYNTGYATSANVLYSMDAEFGAGNQSLSVDGATVYSGTSATSITTSLSSYLFALNMNGTASFLSKIRLYSCQIHDNGTLVRDFAPCMNSSNVCGLYDRVNKVFYPSASSTALLPPDGTVGTITVNGTAYQCEQGMTWSEWVASAYNTGGYKVSGTQINDSTGDMHVDGVTTTSTINLGTSYILASNVVITWTTKSGTWNSSSYSSAKDGKKWTCVSPGSNGSTVIQCTFSGVTSITFNCVYNGESNYDYLTVGSLDSACTRSSYGTTLTGTSGTAKDITFNCTSAQHYVQFCYSKDSSVDTDPDNATVYIKAYS